MWRRIILSVILVLIIMTTGCGAVDTMSINYHTKEAKCGDTSDFSVYNGIEKQATFDYKVIDSGKYKDHGILGVKTELHEYVYLTVTITNNSTEVATPDDIKFYIDGEEITNDRVPYDCNSLVMRKIQPGETIKGTIYKVCDNYDTCKSITAKAYNTEIKIK